MAYVPPNRRKPKTEDEKHNESLQIIRECSDKHFPSLGGSGPVVSRGTISYGEKAKEWEQKRIETEIKDRVDARMAEYQAEKKKQQELECIAMPNFSRRREAHIVMPLPVVEPVLPKLPAEEEWVTVEKKLRKPKNEINYDDEPRYDEKYDHLAQDEDSLWN
jgi:hypothetical protein